MRDWEMRRRPSEHLPSLFCFLLLFFFFSVNFFLDSNKRHTHDIFEIVHFQIIMYSTSFEYFYCMYKLLISYLSFPSSQVQSYCQAGKGYERGNARSCGSVVQILIEGKKKAALAVNIFIAFACFCSSLWAW